MPERQLREHLSPPALLVHCRDTRGDAPAATAPSASRQNTDTQREDTFWGGRGRLGPSHKGPEERRWSDTPRRTETPRSAQGDGVPAGAPLRAEKQPGRQSEGHAMQTHGRTPESRRVAPVFKAFRAPAAAARGWEPPRPPGAPARHGARLLPTQSFPFQCSVCPERHWHS